MDPCPNDVPVGVGAEPAATPDRRVWVANDSASGPYKVNSLILNERVDPLDGDVVWDPARSLWNGGMLLAAVVLGPMYFSPSAFLVFAILLELTMCSGHSVGFHRRLIHRTFACPKWLEHLVGK